MFPAIRTMLAAVLLVTVGACTGDDPTPPNLLVIVSDALRADALGCYGSGARTPNIDRLAEKGVLFEHCNSTSPWTWPSSVSMFTGKYPGAYIPRVHHFFPERQPPPDPLVVAKVPDEEHLFSEKLLAADYDVRMALQNPFPLQSNSLQGFVEFENPKPPMLNPKIEPLVGRPVRNSPELFPLLNYLHDVPDNRPFYLLTWFFDPHCKYKAPPRFRRRIDTGEEPLPREEDFYTDLDFRQLRRLTSELSAREKAYIKALYLAEVEFVDQRVGYILTMLEHRGLDSSTIVVLTSDHGEAFWEHGFPSHGNSYYEEMVRTPLIVTGPGLACGERVKSRVSLVDLTPTLAELVGIELPDEVQGNSLVKHLQGNDQAPVPLYISGAHRQRQHDAVLYGDFKLIVGVDGSHELYNLLLDPEETVDVSADYPEVVARLERHRSTIRGENIRLREKWESAGLAGPDTEEDQEFLEHLKALGYVD